MWTNKQVIVDKVDNYVHMCSNGDLLCGEDCGEIKCVLAYNFK